MSLATLTQSGRAAIARAILAQPLYLAWGSGDPAWDAMAEGDLPSLKESTALRAEVGRRIMTSTSFCLPDATGEICVPVGIMPDGSADLDRYSLSESPTPYIYLRCAFDFEDSPNAIIREVGIFMNTEPVSDLAPGQLYLSPAQVADPGILLALQIVRPSINRSPSVRQILEFVLPI